MVKVKICGLSRIEDVLAAAQAGADFLGFVFAKSRRRINSVDARQMIVGLPGFNPRPAVVGVFVNTPAEEVNRIGRYCGLDWVQLSGNETWDYCRQIHLPVIKALRVSPGRKVSELLADIKLGRKVRPEGDVRFLLDTPAADAYGGTGRAFDWRIAREISVECPVMIAGGLCPENVGRLIEEAGPWGVDVSSGVETNGLKDARKIRAFVKSARSAGSGRETYAGNNEK
jgi:phosphoribosylanthranilate isomerase